ncbi:MAG: InlB B-repeat-containing protein [Bacilli bacterium]
MIRRNVVAFLFLLLPLIATSCNTDNSSESSGESSNSSSSSVDPSTEYTVTFDLNYSGAESAPDSQTVLVNTKVVEPTAPTRTDYEFINWSSDYYGSDAWDFGNDVVISDMTLYAAWRYSYVEPPIPKKMFYLNAPAFWLVDSYTAGIYAWSDEDGPKKAWPGEKMTPVEGEIFSLEVPVNYDKMLFARLTPSGLEPEAGIKSQTSDIDLSLLDDEALNYFTVDETVYYGDSKCRGRWSVYPNEPEPYPIEETKTIYVDIPTYWHTDGDVAGIYLAQGDWTPFKTWPGDKMTLVSGEIYSFDVPESYTRVIFNKMTAAGEQPIEAKKAQTENLIIPIDGKNFYTIAETAVYKPTNCSGAWSTYTPI